TDTRAAGTARPRLREPSKGRAAESAGVFERRATPLGPMERRPNAEVISRRGLRARRKINRCTEGTDARRQQGTRSRTYWTTPLATMQRWPNARGILRRALSRRL